MTYVQNLQNMDSINIYNLEVYAYHGVLPEETTLGQKFIVSATIYSDTHVAGHSDELADSINYASICSHITNYMTKHTFKLIEAVAENLANDLLLTYSGIYAITLEIKKPQAPIGLPLDTVSVKITRGWHTAYIALGSNIGDKSAYINSAITALNNDSCCKILKVSDLITTTPYGYTKQDEFLNGVLCLRTLYSPQELLALVQQIEKNANRVREIHWGPRTLDLDIIFYDNLIVAEDNLVIPHTDMINRDFVLSPLNQIAPYHIHPVYNKSVHELWLNLHHH